VDQFTDIPAWAGVAFGVWLLAGITVYISVGLRVLAEGGKVSSAEFKQPDLMVCWAFIAYILLNIGTGFGQPEHDVTQKEITRGALFFWGIVVLLYAFMLIRGINPFRQFGIFRRNFFLCLAMGVGLLLAAHPMVLVIEGVTAAAMHGQAQPQNVVEYFRDVSEKSDFDAICTMLLLAVVVAPVAEETIFRGYIYGVLKRYFGGIGAGLFSAALFAGLHLNVAALPALFVLALCLTLAYEATGSLLVNIFMHGFFNLSMLLTMLYLAGHPPTQ
jgi:membrane protease YdiL (CAAX protease family)